MPEPTAQKTFSALERLKDALIKANISEDNAAFILGRLSRTITEAVIAEVAKNIDETQLRELSAVQNEEEKMAKMAQFFEQKTGKSINSLREEITDKMVAEFESLE